jgi:hypothetical protein
MDSVHERMAGTAREKMPLATGAAQHKRLCGRHRDDIVADRFCGRQAPKIRSFIELRDALGLGPEDDSRYAGFALNGHSTALSSRSVSAINPRLILLRPSGLGAEFLALAFVRGEQFAETVVKDRATGEFRFYLTRYTQACNEAPNGCSPGDLLTEAVEADWKTVDVYAEEDLVNTPLDCLVCHQPDGPGTPKLLRMQEFEPPWNHWFYHLATGGRALIADYLAAKGDEPFAGITYVNDSNPGLLSSTLRFENSGGQPNAYVSTTIEAEVEESAALAGGKQPEDNSVPGESETWKALYARANAGKAIGVPYHDVKVTDSAKLARMTQAYVDYREGRMARQDLPDIRDVRPDDPTLLAHMGLATEPGLDGEGVLLQACAQCHNARLDQTLSRARFHVNINKLSRAEKELAIARISLTEDDPSLMPPARFRTLSAEAKKRLIALLER